MRKLRLFLNFDKEEAWLNRMAADGQLLSRAGFSSYTFRKIESGTAVVRVDYQPSMSEADYADYVNLFADSGWQHLCGSRKGGAQYFASFNAEPNADIFSDAGSRAGRYRRSIAGLSVLGLAALTFCVILKVPTSLFQSPRNWYRTPGLWDKHGLDFLGSFSFETLFVVPGVGAQILLVAITAFGIAGVVYQGILYHKATRNQGV